MSLPLEMAMAFKSVHVLNDVLKAETPGGKARLKATHYATVLIQGREPLWGVWTIGGKFIMFAGSREQIARHYKSKAWTRVMASWLLADGQTDLADVGKRVRALEERFGTRVKRGTREAGAGAEVTTH